MKTLLVQVFVIFFIKENFLYYTDSNTEVGKELLFSPENI